MYKTNQVQVKENLAVEEKMEKDIVKVVVLDGTKGTAYVFRAPFHGTSAIETVKGEFRFVKRTQEDKI